jgi:hypothetical protein
METRIRAGQRVLYKDGNSGWLVGIIDNGNAEVNEQGIWIPIVPLRFADMAREDVPYIQYAEINTLFTEGRPLDDWMKPTLLKKEDYIKIIESEDFERALENAWVSDGEYYYYPVSTYTEKWIDKQPFNYILRSV